MPDGALEFLLKLDAQVDGALKMVRAGGAAEEALRKLDKVVGDAEKKIKKLNEEAGKGEGAFKRMLKAGLEPFAERLKSIGEFEFIRRGVDALIELPEKLIDVVKELGEEVLLASGKMQEARITFRALFGGEGGDKLIDYADALGNKTGMIDDEWRSIERTLGNAGVKLGTQMDHATALVSDLAALGGGGAGAASYATDLVARMRNLGEISARQLVGFGLNQKDFWTELSRQTGTGVALLKKRVGEGKVDVEALEATVEQLVTRKTGKRLGGLGADIGEDFNSRLKRLRNLPDQIFESFEKSPGFSHVSAFIDKLTKAFDPDSALGQRLIDDLGSIGKFLAGLDIDRVVSSLETVAGWLERIVKLLGLAGGVLGAAPVAAGGLALATPAERGQMAEGLNKGFFGGTRGELDQLSVGQRALRGLAPIPRFFRSIFGSSGDATGKGLASGIAGQSGAVAKAAEGLGDVADKAARDRLGVHSPSRVFEDIGRQSVAGYRKGIEGAAGEATAAVGAALSPPARGGAGAGRLSISMPVTVQVGAGHGGDARAIATEVAARLEELLPSKLAAALEQVVIEAGA